MKTLEVSKATKPLSDYAREIGTNSLVVVKNGKPLAVLSPAEGIDAESIALANNPKFVRMIKRSRQRHKREGGIPIEEIRRRLGLKRPRSTRKKRGS